MFDPLGMCRFSVAVLRPNLGCLRGKSREDTPSCRCVAHLIAIDGRPECYPYCKVPFLPLSIPIAESLADMSAISSAYRLHA